MARMFTPVVGDPHSRYKANHGKSRWWCRLIETRWESLLLPRVGCSRSGHGTRIAQRKQRQSYLSDEILKFARSDLLAAPELFNDLSQNVAVSGIRIRHRYLLGRHALDVTHDPAIAGSPKEPRR